MIEELEQILHKNNLLQRKKIKELNKSCCKESNIEVIDFDYVKDEFCKSLGIQTNSSVDGIYFCKTKNHIYLIELKSFSKWFEKYKSEKNSYKNFLQFLLSEKGQEKKIENKLFDSMLLIACIGGLNQVDKSFYKSILDQDKSKIKFNFLFVTNLSARDFMKYRIANLSSRFKYKFLNRISFILCQDLEKDILKE
jgi:hypothetical protein